MPAKNPPNHGEPWTDKQVRELERLAKGNTPTRVIALKLGRTEDSIYGKASAEDISLDPPNQRPYSRRKK